jgi:predicted transcriptional regulator
MDDEKVLMEERYLPEKEGLLGSRATAVNADGSIQKYIKIPFCDSCGQMLKGEIVSVCSCGRKVCPSCAIIHENQVYCRACAKQITALRKEDYFVLQGLANETSPKDIKHASALGSDALEEALETLLERGMIETKGISVFTRYSVTSKGLAVLATCEQIYRNEGDVTQFLTKLQELSEG